MAASDGGEVLHALLLDPAAGPVELDLEVSAAIRERVDVSAAEGAGLVGERVVLTPAGTSGPVGAVALPVR